MNILTTFTNVNDDFFVYLGERDGLINLSVIAVDKHDNLLRLSVCGDDTQSFVYIGPAYVGSVMDEQHPAKKYICRATRTQHIHLVSVFLHNVVVRAQQNMQKFDVDLTMLSTAFKELHKSQPCLQNLAITELLPCLSLLVDKKFYKPDYKINLAAYVYNHMLKHVRTLPLFTYLVLWKDTFDLFSTVYYVLDDGTLGSNHCADIISNGFF